MATMGEQAALNEFQVDREYTLGQQRALLSWVNTSFDLSRKVTVIPDFLSGHLFAEMLHDVDPHFDLATIDQTAHDKSRIKTMLDGFSRYLDTDEEVESLKGLIDFRQLSSNLSINTTCRLLSLFAHATSYGKQGRKYITKMQQGDMSEVEKGSLAQIIQGVQEERERIEDGIASGTTKRMQPTDAASAAAMDRELELEAKIAQLEKDLDRLKKQLADIITNNDKLQESYAEACEEIQQKQDEIKQLEKARGEHDSGRLKFNSDKIHEQDRLIAEQEAQLEDNRHSIEVLRRENEELAKKADRVQELTDQVSELKHERESLTKKVNVAEHLRKKLNSQMNIQKDLDNLNAELVHLKPIEIEFRALQESHTKLIRHNLEYGTILQAAESEKHVQTIKMRSMEEERRVLVKENAELKQKIVLLEGQVQDRDEQLLNRRFDGSPATSEKGDFNLEQELEGASDPTAILNLEISKLRAENKLLRSSLGAASEDGRLLADLEESKLREELLQKKFNDISEKHAVGQEQISALMNSMTAEGDQAYISLKNAFLDADHNLKTERNKVRQLEAKVADQDRDLLALRTDKNAYQKSSIDALEELKSTDELISGSLKAELDIIRKRNQTLEIEVDQQKKQLLDVYVSKEKLRQQYDNSASAPLSPAADHEGVYDAQIAEIVRQSNEKIEKLGRKLRQMREQLDSKDQERYELQKRLKAAEAGDAYAAQKAANEQIIRNLQRENHMISTAWYDLTSRLQSNHVVLQRRQDMPKSWLNKQRQMVMNATPRK